MVIDDSDAAPDHPLCPDASTAPAAHTPAPTSPGEATELACHPDACPALATVPLVVPSSPTPAHPARISQHPRAGGPTFLLLAIPTLLLTPATPPARSHTAAITARIARFLGGDWDALIAEALHRRTPLAACTTRRARAATPTPDERRIAPIGEVLARLLQRAACLQLREPMARVFLPSQQFGVGVTCGTELVVRGVRRGRADHPDWVVVELDVANAFNSYHRDRLFEALRASSEFRCLIPFGDPLSPFLFALTQRLALEPVLADGDVQLWSYADDTYVLGTPERVLQSFTAIQRRLGELGLSVQPHKCLVYPAASTRPEELAGFTALGLD
ncbi:hypothetical protein CLOM_g17437, partial [Closterium sp. NIES-68]